MVGQLVLSVVLSFAQLTAVISKKLGNRNSLFLVMALLMIIPVSYGGESFRAVLAFEGLLARMLSLVNCQVSFLGILFPATWMVTYEFPFPATMLRYDMVV